EQVASIGAVGIVARLRTGAQARANLFGTFGEEAIVGGARPHGNARQIDASQRIVVEEFRASAQVAVKRDDGAGVSPPILRKNGVGNGSGLHLSRRGRRRRDNQCLSGHLGPGGALCAELPGISGGVRSGYWVRCRSFRIGDAGVRRARQLVSSARWRRGAVTRFAWGD